MVRLLLNRGLDETHRDNAGWTPLHVAAYYGHKKVGGRRGKREEKEIENLKSKGVGGVEKEEREKGKVVR